MPMTARCGATALCRGATTVRVAAHETSGGKVMAVWIAQSACSCSRIRNSWQSRPSHVHQCVPHNQPTPCMRCSIRSSQSATGSAGATVWIATSFCPRPCVFVHTLACRCSRTEFSSMPSHAAAAARALCSFHHSPRVRQLSDSRCSAARTAAPHRAVMGIKRRPVERPVEHACAEAPRAPRN